MKKYNHNNIPGCIKEENNIQALDCLQAGLNTKYKYATRCLLHNTIVVRMTIGDALLYIKKPFLFCPLCSNPNFKMHDFEFRNDKEEYTINKKKYTRDIYIAICKSCGQSNKYLGSYDIDAMTIANNIFAAFGNNGCASK